MLQALELLQRDDLTPCDAYTALWTIRLEDARRWAFATYLVGLTAVLALVAAIVLVFVGQNGPAIASGVGLILTGGATTSIWSRRNHVQTEAESFLAKVTEYCSVARQQDLGIR